MLVAIEGEAEEREVVARLVDSTGLINTSVGRHIVGWDPPPTKEMFVNNAHTSVCNGWAVRGLQALAEMANQSESTRMGTSSTDSTRINTTSGHLGDANASSGRGDSDGDDGRNNATVYQDAVAAEVGHVVSERRASESAQSDDFQSTRG